MDVKTKLLVLSPIIYLFVLGFYHLVKYLILKKLYAGRPIERVPRTLIGNFIVFNKGVVLGLLMAFSFAGMGVYLINQPDPMTPRLLKLK